MLKAVIVLSVAVTVVRPWTVFAANETSWQPESAEAAERQLEKARDAAGKLRRFEADFSVSEVDTAIETDTRWRVHLYAEEAAGFLLDCRPLEIGRMTGRRSASGRPCRLSTREPETWLYANGVCTIVDEVRRSYETAEIGPKSWLAPFRTAPHQLVPPWLDPTIDWKELKSQFRIEQAKSTGTEFFIDLVPQKEMPKGQWITDDRLDASHQLLIDRQTCLPKKWRMTGNFRDRVITYTRFDVDPAKRELKVALSGYQKGRKVPEAPAPSMKDAKETPDALTLCFRALMWWLF